MKESSKNFNFAMLTYFVIVVLFVALRMISAFGLLDGLGDYSSVVFTILVQIVLLFGGGVLLFSALKKQKPAQTLEFYGCKSISKKVAGLTVLLGIVVFFLNVFVSSTFNSLIDFFGYEHASSPLPSSYGFDALFVNLIFSALLPGICEELVHRGMLLKTMRPMGMWKAIIFSGLLFGLLHMNIEQFFYATIIGIFLGFLTVMSNSIYPAMIVHFANNALSVYLSFSRVNNLPLGQVYEWFFGVISSNLFLGILLCTLVLLILAYLLYVLCHKIFAEQLKNDLATAAKKAQKNLAKQAYFLDLESVKNGSQNAEIMDPRLEIIKQLFSMQPAAQEKFSPPKLGQFLMWLVIALMGAITIFTFVWGVL